MSNFFSGSKWAQTYAKKSLPVLVSFADAHATTTYTELASILLADKNYAHPLMSALGRLGYALRSLNEAAPAELGKIPPIQLLVCNQKTGRPGNLALGFLGFKRSETDKMSKLQLDTVVSAAHQKIFEYPHWNLVLRALNLKPLTLKLPAARNILPKISQLEKHSAGEGKEHKRLKLFLAENPERIGIQWNGFGDTELLLLSGDRLDVSFRDDGQWIAVEVKPEHSPVADLVRGIFQCIKYKAILSAQLRYESMAGEDSLIKKDPRVILACAAPLSPELNALAKRLRIEVKTGITVPQGFTPKPRAPQNHTDTIKPYGLLHSEQEPHGRNLERSARDHRRDLRRSETRLPVPLHRTRRHPMQDRAKPSSLGHVH